jgi:hypothetical protein
LLFARSRYQHLGKRPGTSSAIFRFGPEVVTTAGQFQQEKNVASTTRKPLFLFLLSGLFLLRFEQRR